MISSRLAALMKWVTVLGAVGGLLVLSYLVNSRAQAERAAIAGREEVPPARLVNDGAVELDAETAERYGLEEQTATSTAWCEQHSIYGQLIPNPRATAQIRAPAAGTLRADAEHPWPEPGQWVQAGELVGWIEIRVPPQERLTLLDNLNSARINRQGAEKVVRLQQERVDRLLHLTQREIASQQQVEDAQVLLTEAKTELAIAEAAVELWQKALAEADGLCVDTAATYRKALRAPAAGQIIAISARPGTSIEAGTLVAELVDFRKPLVRLDFPPQALEAAPPDRVQLCALSGASPAWSGVLSAAENQPPPSAEATLVSPAPQLDAASQLVGYWYAVDDPTRGSMPGDAPRRGPRLANSVWRPGLQVQATVKTFSGEPISRAVEVPFCALLFHQGHTLVYVHTAPTRYERRQVRLLAREGDRAVLAPPAQPERTGVEPGEAVVTEGAQILLSEEFRSEAGGD